MMSSILLKATNLGSAVWSSLTSISSYFLIRYSLFVLPFAPKSPKGDFLLLLTSLFVIRYSLVKQMPHQIPLNPEIVFTVHRRFDHQRYSVHDFNSFPDQ